MSSEPFIGEIKLFAFNYAPVGHRFCDGSVLPVAQNQALFALIGNIYGGTPGQNFALPDLRGRVAVGQGTGPNLSPRIIGEKQGTEKNTLTQANLPVTPISTPITINNVSLAVTTTFKPKATTDNGDSFDPTNAYWANTVNPDKDYKKLPFTNTTAMGEQTTTGTATGNINGNISFPLGSGVGVNNMQPYLVLNYCIATLGIWPSRD